MVVCAIFGATIAAVDMLSAYFFSNPRLVRSTESSSVADTARAATDRPATCSVTSSGRTRTWRYHCPRSPSHDRANTSPPSTTTQIVVRLVRPSSRTVSTSTSSSRSRSARVCASNCAASDSWVSTGPPSPSCRQGRAWKQRCCKPRHWRRSSSVAGAGARRRDQVQRRGLPRG